MPESTYFPIRLRDIPLADQQQILHQLAGLTRGWSGRTVLMAGHYMLVYRRAEDQLVPLMKSIVDRDPSVTEVEREHVKDVGDFPERSLALALGLLADTPTADRKIALVVNDDQFRVFQNIGPQVDVAGLRRKYYWQQLLPEPFREILAEHPQLREVFLPNNASNRERHDSSLPPTNIFFSEKALRNRFEKERRKQLQRTPGFQEFNGTWGGGPKLIYSRPDSAFHLCLVDDAAGCGCSGAMFELLMNLHERHQALNVVLFIPLECVSPVHQTVRAFMQSQGLFHNVLGIWGDRVGPSGEVSFTKATLYQYD